MSLLFLILQSKDTPYQWAETQVKDYRNGEV